MSLKDNLAQIAKDTKQTLVSALPLSAGENDIRNILRRDHELVAGMVEELIERADKDDPSVLELAREMRAELLTHAKSEEAVLYRACLKHGKELKDFAQEGDREHELIEHLLDRVTTERPGRDGEFKATLHVLKEILEHHVREEEGDLFLKLQGEFSAQQLIEMGEMMEDAKASVVIPEPARSN